MRRPGRRLFLSTLCGGALALAGCSMQNLYFLMPEELDKPELGSVVNADKKKTNRVAILVYCPLEVRSEFQEADRLISELLGRELRDHWEENSEKVKLIEPRKIEIWKNSNPEWHSEDLSKIARALRVDYLIYLEINALSIYQKNAYSSLYDGLINGKVYLYDTQRQDTKEARIDYLRYPSKAHPIPVDADTPAPKFQRMFMEYVAHRLSAYFLPHHKRERAYMEVNRDGGLGE